jgi:hypothetical protein
MGYDLYDVDDISICIVYINVHIKPFLLFLSLFPAIVSQNGGVPNDCSHGSLRRQRMRPWVVPLSSRSLWQLITRTLRPAVVAMGRCVCVCGGRPTPCARVNKAGIRCGACSQRSAADRGTADDVNAPCRGLVALHVAVCRMVHITRVQLHAELCHCLNAQKFEQQNS